MKKANYKALSIICCYPLPCIVHAYVGPGAGLSAIGTILAFLGAIFLLIVGFFWYPIKRLFKNKRNNTHEIINEASESNSDSRRDES